MDRNSGTGGTAADAQPRKLEVLGKLSGGIAHDFNNILSIVEGYATIALKRHREGRLEEDQLKKIIDASQRGAVITRQLLAFGRQKVQIEETVDLCELIRRNEVIIRPQFGSSVAVRMEGLDQAYMIDCAPDGMTQILLNLASNARDAMPDGGNFRITLEPCGSERVPARCHSRDRGNGFVRLSIEDTGCGIPPDIMERIFDPFFTTKEQDKGTGLGLSVVYGLIEQMGGAIEASSVPGVGARFDLFFPVSEKPPAASPRTAEDGSPGDSLKGKTVLVVEDENDLRDILCDMLEEAGLRVVKARNGNEALVAQDEHDGPIDFLVTDVMMPGMNGTRLAELVLSLRPDMRVVFVSGYPFLNVSEGFSLPADIPCLSKPFQSRSLIDALTQAKVKGG